MSPVLATRLRRLVAIVCVGCGLSGHPSAADDTAAVLAAHARLFQEAKVSTVPDIWREIDNANVDEQVGPGFPKKLKEWDADSPPFSLPEDVRAPFAPCLGYLREAVPLVERRAALAHRKIVYASAAKESISLGLKAKALIEKAIQCVKSAKYRCIARGQLLGYPASFEQAFAALQNSRLPDVPVSERQQWWNDEAFVKLRLHIFQNGFLFIKKWEYNDATYAGFVGQIVRSMQVPKLPASLSSGTDFEYTSYFKHRQSLPGPEFSCPPTDSSKGM